MKPTECYEPEDDSETKGFNKSGYLDESMEMYKEYSLHGHYRMYLMTLCAIIFYSLNC